MKVNSYKLFIKIIFLLLPISIISQSAGESTYQFLNIPVSPRQLALGGKTITTFDNDVSMALYNPSTINQEMDNIFSFNYFNYFSDISYGNISYAYRLNNRGSTLHFGFKYINFIYRAFSIVVVLHRTQNRRGINLIFRQHRRQHRC